MARPTLGLQLYTVRQALAADYVGTVRKVAEMGYEAIELAGAAPMGSAEFKGLLDELGLRVAGMHVPIDQIEDKLSGSIALARALGTENLVCPYVPDTRRGSREAWVQIARTLDQAGAKCREEGLRLSYHNHSFEFVQYDETYALDLLYENTDPQNVFAELDVYWVADGGEDPVEYINRYAGRISILHLKDRTGGEKPTFTEIGNGVLDWPAIHKAALAAGVEWYCVEQDVCPGDPLQSARTSQEFVARLIG